jgi:hypothetical protein
MAARLERAIRLYRWAFAKRFNPILIASGGVVWGDDPGATEGKMIARWLYLRRARRIAIEELSKETVGNFGLSAMGLIIPAGIRRVTAVTDCCHARRVGVVGKHILAGICDLRLSIVPTPLDPIERSKELRKEADGMNFVRRFLAEVPPGKPLLALDWISANHRAHPYSGLPFGSAIEHNTGGFLSSQPQTLSLYPEE